MAEKYKFFDPVQREDGTYDREYSAQEFTDYFKTLINTGILKAAGNQLHVAANGSNMMTTIDTGVAFILGRYYENDSLKELLHDTESLGNSRIDRIVIRMDLSTEARYVKAFIKKGIPSANPAAPALTQTSNLYEISLAQVKIIGGQTFLPTNAVTDERGVNAVCPWAGSNLLPSFDDNALSQHSNNATLHIPYAVAGGGANVYTARINGVSEYVEGMALSIKILAQNTGASTININGLGARSIIKANGGTVGSGNLKAGSIYTLRYNGTAFILQGEGGAGNAVVSDVLSGKTFTNDSGELTGSMINRSGVTTIGTHVTSGASYVDLAPASGFYDGAPTSRARITDNNFVASNIKSGVSIFGVGGTLQPKNFLQVRRSFSIPYNANTIPISINCGFPPKDYVASGMFNFGQQFNLTGSFGRVASASYFWGERELRLDSGPVEMGGGTRTLMCWMMCSYDSYVSGNTLYFILQFRGDNDFVGTNIISAQTIEINFNIWG